MKEKKQTGKKPYLQPKIVKVKLLAEEAILTGCKVTDTANASVGATNCDVVSHAQCSAQGS
ncbi:MAG: hypothetical protein HY466_02640 [Deltaproteobacteria bacterium]|nr:hypothetical protein [Deltaproteobacteria bacterium]